MYWFSVPAILKGWMDRVLTKGFAYTDKQGISEGLFNVWLPLNLCLLCCMVSFFFFFLMTHFFCVQGTKALLSFTTGSQESMFSVQGVNGDIKDTLCPILVLHQWLKEIDGLPDPFVVTKNPPHHSAARNPALLWLQCSWTAHRPVSSLRHRRGASEHAGGLAMPY